MVTFYQRLDYKSRKKPLVSQIIIYFFTYYNKDENQCIWFQSKKESVESTSSVPTIIHSRKDHSISGWSPQLLLQELSQVRLQFHPKDVVADKRTVHRLTTAVFRSFRNETDTNASYLRNTHLVCRFDPVTSRSKGVIESTQPVKLYGTSLWHVISQHACQFHENSIGVGTAHSRLSVPNGQIPLLLSRVYRQ